MTRHYHITFKGWDDYRAFAAFRDLYGIKYDTMITTGNGTNDVKSFDVFVDLTNDELLQLKLTCSLLACKYMPPRDTR